MTPTVVATGNNIGSYTVESAGTYAVSACRGSTSSKVATITVDDGTISGYTDITSTASLSGTRGHLTTAIVTASAGATITIKLAESTSSGPVSYVIYKL